MKICLKTSLKRLTLLPTDSVIIVDNAPNYFMMNEHISNSVQWKAHTVMSYIKKFLKECF